VAAYAVWIDKIVLRVNKKGGGNKRKSESYICHTRAKFSAVGASIRSYSKSGAIERQRQQFCKDKSCGKKSAIKIALKGQ
jgi:hypothetical protein